MGKAPRLERIALREVIDRHIELHAGTSEEKLAPAIDSASQGADDFLVYER